VLVGRIEQPEKHAVDAEFNRASNAKNSNALRSAMPLVREVEVPRMPESGQKVGNHSNGLEIDESKKFKIEGGNRQLENPAPGLSELEGIHRNPRLLDLAEFLDQAQIW